MNAILKNWQFVCLAYVACALVAAPIYMKDIELALPFYSAQCFIVIVTALFILMGLGLERLLEELEGLRPHQS
jgi:hypothetical protein